MSVAGAAVAIAVVSFNTREPLAICLQSMAAEVEDGRATVWVVDNGSRDGSVEMVRDRFAWAELIEPAANLGYGAAVNLVVERTDAPWIVAANADIALEPGALDALLAAGDAHPGAGALAPALILGDGSFQHSVHAFPSPWLSLAHVLGLARVWPGLGDRLCLNGHWDAAREREVEWAHGACLLLRRDAFEAAGGFDPRQWMYAEDLDLAWRLRALGAPTRYVPAARVSHTLGAATAVAFAERRAGLEMEAAYDWLARRRGIAVARLHAAINVVGGGVRLAVLALAAIVRPQRFAISRERELRYLRLHARGFLRPRRGRGTNGQ